MKFHGYGTPRRGPHPLAKRVKRSTFCISIEHMTSSESITNPFLCCYSSPQLQWSHFPFSEYCVSLDLGRGVSFILNYSEAITLHLHQRNRLGLCIRCFILVYRNPTVSNVEGEYEHYYPLSSSINRTCIILIVVLFVLQCLILIICSLSAIYCFFIP